MECEYTYIDSERSSQKCRRIDKGRLSGPGITAPLVRSRNYYFSWDRAPRTELLDPSIGRLWTIDPQSKRFRHEKLTGNHRK